VGTPDTHTQHNHNETSRTIAGWKIDDMSDEEKEKACKEFRQSSEKHVYLDSKQCMKEEVKEVASWLEELITRVLDNNAKPARMCNGSKPWWNTEIRETRI
jgi:hypothetical protein